jgi:hypothetical protein
MGAVIHNILSEGVNGECFLTFSFGWRFEGVVEGSTEETEKGKSMKPQCLKALNLTIERIEELVKEGKV